MAPGRVPTRTTAADGGPRSDGSDLRAMVGRDAELRTVVDAARMPPSVVLVEGEPGVGKTHLLDAVRRHPALKSWRHLSGHCQQLREPFPLGPIVEALTRIDAPPRDAVPAVAGGLRTLIPELTPFLPPPLERLDDARAERHRILRGIVELVGALGPVVLTLDDVQWAGDDTVEAIVVLATELPPNACLILSFRGGDVPEDSPLRSLGARTSHGTIRLRLGPLPTDGVRKLMAQVLGEGSLPQHLVRVVEERTSGLPFAVEEVVRLLAVRGALRLEGGLWVASDRFEQAAVPDAIRDSIGERLARMSEDAQAAMRAAAILRLPVRDRVIGRVAGLRKGATEAALLELLRGSLLIEGEDGTIAPRHALAGQAVYDAIPGPVRRRLHRRAAELLAIEDPTPDAQLAYHHRAAGDVTAWVRHAEAAADSAAALGDFASAFRSLQEATGAPRLPRATRVRLAVKLGEAASHTLADARAIEIIRALLDEEPLPPPARGKLRFALGGLLIQQGSASESYSEFRAAVEDLRSEPALRARAMSALAVPCFVEGRLADHRRWSRRAGELAQRHGDTFVRTAVQVNDMTLAMSAGDPAAWDAIATLPSGRRSIREKRERVRALFNLSSSAFHLGHYERAEALLVEGQAISRELDYGRLVPALDVTSLLLRWATGRWDGLEQAAEYALDAVGDELTERAEALLVAGSLAAARNRREVAEKQLSHALELATRSGWVPVMTAAAGRLSRARLDEGAGSEHATIAMEVVRLKGIWTWAWGAASEHVRALCSSEGEDEGAAFVVRLERGLRGRDAPAARAELLSCRGHLALSRGDPGSAARVFLGSAARWSSIGNVFEEALSRHRAAVALLEAGSEDGEPQLRAALAAFEALDASAPATAVRSTFARYGLAAPSRRGRKGYGPDLSPRERDVAEMVAAGKSNREVGEALFLSPRTVAHHLTSAMRKLGVRSRTALAVAALRSARGEDEGPNFLGHSDDHKLSEPS